MLRNLKRFFIAAAPLALPLTSLACVRMEPNALPASPGTVATAPPTQPMTAKRKPLAFPFATESEAVQKTIHCLNRLSATGASESAVAETRALLARCDATSKPFGKVLATIVRGVLSYSDTPISGRWTMPSPSREISTALVERSAAACAVRREARNGDIVLSFAGDCTFGTVNGDDSAVRFPFVYRRSGHADYPFALVRPWLLNDDLSVVNFECTLTNARSTADKQWKFKGPARYAQIFPASSVEVAGIANNHSHDYLEQGFRDTVANFKKASVPTFYQSTPYITTIRGVETVLIGDCTVVGENTTVIGKTPERVLSQIKRYKKPGNIVVVVMHWGSELDTVPRPWQQQLGRRFIDAGADAVVGHHPHVVQGIEQYKSKYIAYSLGNFAFGGNSQAHSPDTFLLRLHFRSVGNTLQTQPASIVPCSVTSSTTRNDAGVLRNNYQPEPVFGRIGDGTANLILKRSARLNYGVKTLNYLRLP